METKTCTGCKEIKPVEEFAFRNKAKNIRRANCKKCIKKYDSIRYVKNRQDIRERNKKHHKMSIERNSRYIYEFLKNSSCIDCEEKDPVVLEFDHVNEDKKYAIGDMVWGSFSTKTIQKEMDKCEVRCANCHKKRHAKQNGYRRHLYALE